MIAYQWWWKKLKKVNIWDRSFRYKHRGIRSARVSKFQWRFLKFWNTSHWTDVKAYLNERHSLGFTICPAYKGKFAYKLIFRCLEETPFDQVKIVIVCQEPYYQKDLADGLLFSVRPNVKKVPLVLKNIFQEYRRDLGYRNPLTGDLSTWARNGILLLPSVWTIESERATRAGRVGHHKKGGKWLWQALTFEILEELSKRKDRLVFMFWGKKAQENKYIIDQKKHLVLTACHPSPRNFTYSGKEYARFNGCSHFSQACEYLDINKNIWKLP